MTIKRLAADMDMRAGLFGGTFNPIHNGHLMVAAQVLQRFRLDRLFIIPCRVPPHKSPAYLAPAADRAGMIQLALPADERYRLSEVESRREGPSYTIDTVTHFASAVVPGAALFLLMGMDAFLEIHTWKRWRTLLGMVQPVVVSRRLEDEAASDDDLATMEAYIRSCLSADYASCGQQGCWQHSNGNRIHLLRTTPLKVSSSQVRRRIGAGRSFADLVPGPVKAYIDEKELYR